MKRSSYIVSILACALALAAPLKASASDLEAPTVHATYRYSVLHQHYPVISLRQPPLQKTVNVIDENRDAILHVKKQRKKNLRRFYMKLLAVVSAQ